MSSGINTGPGVAVDYDPFAGAALARVVPSTEPQREVWLADQLGREASLAYNESVSLRLRGALNMDALRGALQDVVGRHEALRSTLAASGEDLRVAEHVDVPIETIDLSRLTSGERSAAVAMTLRRVVETPFDLEHGPLFGAMLLRLADDDHQLIITAHHVVCDGWSYGVICRDLANRYAHRAGAQVPALPPAPSFADYAVAQAQLPQSPEFIADEQFWLSRFPGMAPTLDLTTDRPRPAQRCFDSGREDVMLPADLVAAVRQMSAKRGAGLFAGLLAGFGLLLQRLTQQDDIVIAIPAAGQSVGGLADLVGHCVHALPLRLSLTAQQTFSELLTLARGTLLDALEHQQFTLGTLLKKLAIPRDPSRLPLTSVLFNLDQALDGKDLPFPGLQVEFSGNPRTYENFELFVNAVQVDGALRLECQYNSELFDAGTVRRWMEGFENLLRGAVAKPEAPAASLPLVGESQTHALRQLQRPATAFDRSALLHTLLAAQIAKTPDRIAVSGDGASWNYGELRTRAHRIAQLLRSRGIERGSLVGVCLSRSPDLLAAVLGVLQAGAGYVPLDPDYPRERLAFMVEDSGLALVLSDSTLIERLPIARERSVLLDRDAAVLAAMPDSALSHDERSADPESVAYVIYTSGSTGQPKGVQVPHRAVVNFLTSMQREPGLSADDTLVAVTTLSFDIAVLELYLPLSVGAHVVLSTREQALDGHALKALLERSRATVMQGTPATWRLLLEADWRAPAGFKALCGGEALSEDLAARLLAQGVTLWNMYGPTETTVWSTCAKIDVPQRIGIGKPIANTTVWILDAQRQLCPIGVPGELWIGGEGVTLGYRGRPELTAERFIADPFADSPVALLYRTGDRGRWLADGTLQHLGRLDDQVKVRGYRIELGEIEAALSTHASVARAVALAREDQPGDVRLVAYVVAQANHTIDAGALRAHLQTTLPNYMIVQHVVTLEAIPLLPNGKIDRRSLPAPSVDSLAALAAHEHVAPRDDLERAVAAAMEFALSLPGLGVHDNFFELGGHSLLAAQLTARINRELGLMLPLRTLFEAPTIAKLAAAIRAVAKPSSAAVAPHATLLPRADQRRAPLSLMQQRMWFLEQLNPGRVVFNTPSAHRLHGRLDLGAFERALREVVRRQAALRTAIVVQDGFGYQLVEPEAPADLLPVEDLAHLPSAERERVLKLRLEELANEAFDLTQAPLFRARLFRLGDEEHAWFFMTHHIIWDGWSFDLLYIEMATLYAAYSAGRTSPLAELALSYGDFSTWHQQWLKGGELGAQLEYWKTQLAGKLEPLGLPADRPRPARTSGAGETLGLTVPQNLATALRGIGRRVDSTLFMALLAAYYVLLYRLSDQRDLIVGTPVRGRDHEEVEPVMGFFVNVLPLRLNIDPSLSFIEFVRTVRTATLNAFAYSQVPYELLMTALDVPRDESRSPIYQALFSYQDIRQRQTHWGELRHQRIELHQRGAAEDLGLWFVEHGDGLAGGLTYNTDILDADTAGRFRDRFLQLLVAIVDNPTQPIAQLDLLSNDDRRELTHWNRRDAEYPRGALLHTLIAEQSQRTPDRIAVSGDGASWNYGELRTRAHRIAQLLRSRGIERGSLVGVCLSRSPDLLAAVLGVLQAGAGYVPLDPDYPRERLAFMVEDSGLALVLSDSTLIERLPIARERSVLLDRDAAVLAAMPDSALSHDERSADPESVAYVIYTSGSTGQPKGVQVPHRAVVNFLTSMQREPGLSADDTLVAVTTLSFDIAVLELYLPLSVGAHVVLSTREQALDGHALKALLERSRATVMQGTPATWRLLLEADWRAPAGFKALCGGEALSEDLAARLLAQGVTLWNMYGPTETTVWSTCAKIDVPQRIGIGKPIANTTVWILDAQRQLCPIGVPGELWIGGEGVTLGYRGRPELTAERFIADPFADSPVALLYRTGDRGRWLADGTLQHLGRLDDQVKVRGYRIELGEIEAALSTHASVARAVALAREDQPGDVRLVAYVVAQANHTIDAGALRAHLQTTLPNYMIVQHVVTLEAIPLLPNGKIDRRSLPAPSVDSLAALAAHEHVAPRTPTEQQLAQVWRELLGLELIDAYDNFFDLGGHSLLAMQAIARMEKLSGKQIAARSYVFQTLAQVAHAYDEAVIAAPVKTGIVGRLLGALRGSVAGESKI